MVEIRELRADEAPLLADMVHTAVVGWRPEVELPPKEWLLEHPQVAPFHTAWGRPGDTALVAEVEGRPVGVAWYRLFTEDEHGEGFVDEDTPEVAIAVVDGHRGQGIGEALLGALHQRAREQGIAQISLSVDDDNPAKRLYVRLGYIDVEGDEHGKMLLALT